MDTKLPVIVNFELPETPEGTCFSTWEPLEDGSIRETNIYYDEKDGCWYRTMETDYSTSYTIASSWRSIEGWLMANRVYTVREDALTISLAALHASYAKAYSDAVDAHFRALQIRARIESAQIALKTYYQSP